MHFLYSIAFVFAVLVNTAEPISEEQASEKTNKPAVETNEQVPEIELSPYTLEVLERLKEELDVDDDTDLEVKLMALLSVISTTENAARGIDALSKPEVYQPLAEALGRFCQGDTELYYHNDTPLAALVPGVKLPLSENHCNFSADRAKIEFGGSDFHRFGYLLTRSPGPTPETHRWTMEIYDDINGVPDLYTFTLDKGDHITREQLIENTLVAYKQLIFENPHNEYLIEKRINFLLRMDRLDLARQVTRESMNGPEPHWMHRMLVVVLDPPDEAEPAAGFEQWARDHGTYGHWLVVAYTYHHLGRVDDMERCVKLALETGPPETHSAMPMNWSVRLGSVAMALFLHEADRRDTCIKLCDTRLSVTTEEEGDRGVEDYLKIRAGDPEPMHYYRGYPINRIDLKKLQQLRQE